MRRARLVNLLLAAGISACLAAPLAVNAQDVAIVGTVAQRTAHACHGLGKQISK
jgi:hypothetical protein